MTQPDAITLEDLTPSEDKALAMLEEAGGWVYWATHEHGGWRVGVAIPTTPVVTYAAEYPTREQALLAAVKHVLGVSV